MMQRIRILILEVWRDQLLTQGAVDSKEKKEASREVMNLQGPKEGKVRKQVSERMKVYALRQIGRVHEVVRDEVLAGRGRLGPEDRSRFGVSGLAVISPPAAKLPLGARLSVSSRCCGASF